MAEQTPATIVITPTGRFDVFLSHNSREKPTVERIAEKLKRAGLEPWLDKWCLTPAGDWQDELAQGLRASGACAVFVGPHGIGSWEDLEYKLAVDRMAKDRAFRVFLVLLPGLPEPFDTSQLPPFLSTRTWVDLRKGVEDARSFQSLVNAVKGLPLGPERPIEPRDDVCPYRGLQPFDEEHAELFFGRDADIQRLIEKLKTARFLAVVGASGSGKSSLVRAGVVPALKRGVLPESAAWTIRVFTPGARPLENLAANLLRLHAQQSMNRTLDELNSDERTLHLAVSLALGERPASERVVWVIDQFEEIFTLCTDERARAQFLANLLYAAFIPGGRNAVLLTLRADFYQKCAAYPELSERIAANQFLVSPMDEENLKQAIEEPAWHVGLEFEQGLVETILDDIQSQPGALPLLEHALLELWERRRGTLLTLEAYRESGGVEGAIAKRADTIYASFTPEQQAIVRRIMLRLTQPGEGTEDTRRRATMDELVTRAGESKAVEDVTQAMADARLLTTGTDEEPGKQVVDVSHEALIRGWPRLRKWIEEDRAGLRILRRLTEAAREWQPTKDESLLYRGARLAQAVEWRERNETALNPLEREFLDASLAAERAVERRRRRVIIGLAAGFVVALALAALALFQWWRANEQAQIARARQLAAESYAQMENQPDLGLLLGVEATRVRASFEPRRALLLDMQYREYLTAFLHGPKSEVHKVLFSPDGKLLAAASGTQSQDNSVRLWDAASGQLLGDALTGHQAAVFSLAFSSDGKLLASGDEQGVVIVWDVASRQSVGQPLKAHEQAVHSLAFSPDNKILASGSFSVRRDRPGSPTVYFEGEAYLWDVATRAPLGGPFKDQLGTIKSLAFSPDGKTLASGNGEYRPAARIVESSIILRDVATGRPLGQPLKGHDNEISSLDFSPDGRLLASGSWDKTVRLWDVAARKPLEGSERLNANLEEPHTSEVLEVQFTRDGKTLISVDAGNHVLVRRLPLESKGDTLALMYSYVNKSVTGYFRRMKSVAFSPETFKWATGGCRKTGADGDCIEAEVSLWDINARLPISRLVAEKTDERFYSVAFSPDGKTLAVGGCAGAGATIDECARSEIYLWDAATRQLKGQLAGTTYALTSLAYSPDGKILAAGSCRKLGDKRCEQGEIRLWGPETRREASPPLMGHNDSVKMLAFSPDGKLLASSAGDNIILWDAQAGRMLGAIESGHKSVTGSPVFSPVRGIAFSPDAKTLASSGCGKIERRAPHGGEAKELCVQGEIRLWDVNTRQVTGQPLVGHADEIKSVAFSPDGKTLASAAGQFDGTILLWDVATRKPLGEALTGYVTDMEKIIFSPSGEMLASVAARSDNNTYNIFLWDVATRQLIAQPLAAHSYYITDIAFSPDGRMLASVSWDQTALLWDMDLESWTANACRVANRNMTRAEWERHFPGEPYRKICPNLPGP